MKKMLRVFVPSGLRGIMKIAPNRATLAVAHESAICDKDYHISRLF
jgi:hypothetical protein